MLKTMIIPDLSCMVALSFSDRKMLMPCTISCYNYGFYLGIDVYKSGKHGSCLQDIMHDTINFSNDKMTRDKFGVVVVQCKSGCMWTRRQMVVN